jgi:Na+/melibiose symporter-like transporter
VRLLLLTPASVVLVMTPVAVFFLAVMARDYRRRIRLEGARAPLRLDLGTLLFSVLMMASVALFVYVRPEWALPYGAIFYAVMLAASVAWFLVDRRRKRAAR